MSLERQEEGVDMKPVWINDMSKLSYTCGIYAAGAIRTVIDFRFPPETPSWIL